ncbi:hypothetical protein [Salinisphaera sp. LB1]|uniref:AtuA-related protein n=1 Tax=Salinisphaera sp. LB1 TaxID=2183911 RepID=UPI000D706526|nr:hypothetical protein [Salinisphaera sp. LB1]AWN15988.1 Small uncharacterized protein [Salinisphaera sp. LB1]
MKVRELAHARTGDKGNISNISVIAFDAAGYARLHAQLTVERLARHFASLAPERVERYDLPTIRAFNFVLHGVLAGGVTRSLALDAHGKCLGSYMLELELPDDWAGSGCGR